MIWNGKFIYNLAQNEALNKFLKNDPLYPFDVWILKEFIFATLSLASIECKYKKVSCKWFLNHYFFFSQVGKKKKKNLRNDWRANCFPILCDCLRVRFFLSSFTSSGCLINGQIVVIACCHNLKYGPLSHWPSMSWVYSNSSNHRIFA